MPHGKLILIVAPSGSGKGVLVEHIKKALPDYHYPVTSTTRAMRPGEKEGVNYHFLTRDEFERKVKDGEFLEWAEYGGNLYGTPKKEILDALSEGRTVIREVEFQGATSIMALIPKRQLTVIYIDSGEWRDLEKRILRRAPMSASELAERRVLFQKEREFKQYANYCILNLDGMLEDAEKELESIIKHVAGLGAK